MWIIVKQYFKSKTITLVGLPLALLSAANLYFEANLTPEEYSMIGTVFAFLITYVRTKTVQPLAEK